MSKKPTMWWSKFNWKHYATDRGLKACSLSAQGLWMRMLCEMANEERYGHLVISGKAMTLTQLAPSVGWPVDVIAPLLEELEAAGVFSRKEDGTIFSRRMVEDYDLYVQRRANGGLGGNRALTGGKTGKEAGVDNLRVKAKNQKESEEDIPATQVPDTPAGMDDDLLDEHDRQASLLPDEPTQKPVSPYKRAQGVCLPILAYVTEKDLDKPSQMRSVGKMFAKLYGDAGRDAERLVDVVQRVPREDKADRAQAIGWIRAQLAKPAPALRLVATNDPMDDWGIHGWCRSAGLEEATDPEDLKHGRWLLNGWFFDRAARDVAVAARLPRSWRGDWQPLRQWMGSLTGDEIVQIVERFARWEGYKPGSLLVFSNRVKEAIAGKGESHAA